MTNKDYKRLTIWNEELQRPCMSADSSNEQTVDIVARHVDRLYELENAIENGTLVFLPCKIGDKVWFLNDYGRSPRIEEYVVDSVEFLKGGGVRCGVHSKGEPMGLISFSLNAIGDYLFTTKEAAEKALEEMKK